MDRSVPLYHLLCCQYRYPSIDFSIFTLLPSFQLQWSLFTPISSFLSPFLSALFPYDFVFFLFDQPSHRLFPPSICTSLKISSLSLSHLYEDVRLKLRKKKADKAEKSVIGCSPDHVIKWCGSEDEQTYLAADAVFSLFLTWHSLITSNWCNVYIAYSVLWTVGQEQSM